MLAGTVAAVRFRIIELAISGDLPFAVLPAFPPQIRLADQCHDDEPCPRP